MKKIILSLAFLATSLTITAAPQTGDGSGIPIKKSRLVRASGVQFQVELTPIACVPNGSASRDSFLANLFSDLESGAELEVVADGAMPASPANYSRLGRLVHWYNLVYSENTPMFMGQLNPGSPFHNETGWVVNWIIEVSTLDGGDGISLEEITFAFSSTDLESSLGQNFMNLEAYSMYARGYKADGTVLSFGDAHQKCQKVRLVAWSRLFNGGGSQSGLSEVEVYVDGFSNFGLNAYVEVGGTKATRTVETNPVHTPLVPSITLNGNILSVTRGAGELQSAASLNGPWTSVGQVQQGYVQTVSGDTKFFRVVQ